jgi:hypothetical protein
VPRALQQTLAQIEAAIDRAALGGSEREVARGLGLTDDAYRAARGGEA